MAGHGSAVDKQETGQNVLSITKELTKMSNGTRRAKKVEGHDKKVFFQCFALDVPPRFQIHSGATGPE